MTRDDDTITLRDAAQHFGFSVYTLRTEAERGHLAQPYYDVEIAKICSWLRANRYTMHVTLQGAVTLRKKQ